MCRVAGPVGSAAGRQPARPQIRPQALESKLANCKSYVKDSSRTGTAAGRDLHRVKPARKSTKIPTQVPR